MPPPLPTLDAGWYRDDAKACDSDGSPPRRAIAADRQHGVLLRVRPSAATVATIATAHSAIAPGVEWTRPAAATRRVELWHPSLERFGAEQLNQRYERRYGRPMDSDAWAGWIAVKILAESALRAHATTSGALQRALTDPRAQFDGHKGRPLVFDARTGELRQPLYTVDAAGDRAPSRVSAEVFPDAWR
jgi:ABC-type branched-subunit amino acid transport system substrate-binding protein